MVSVLRNLKPVTKNEPFLPVFIPLSALNIYYEMSVLQGSQALLGDFTHILNPCLL